MWKYNLAYFSMHTWIIFFLYGMIINSRLWILEKLKNKIQNVLYKENEENKDRKLFILYGLFGIFYVYVCVNLYVQCWNFLMDNFHMFYKCNSLFIVEEMF
jgi:hypothetical protein